MWMQTSIDQRWSKTMTWLHSGWCVSDHCQWCKGLSVVAMTGAALQHFPRRLNKFPQHRELGKLWGKKAIILFRHLLNLSVAQSLSKAEVRWSCSCTSRNTAANLHTARSHKHQMNHLFSMIELLHVGREAALLYSVREHHWIFHVLKSFASPSKWCHLQQICTRLHCQPRSFSQIFKVALMPSDSNSRDCSWLHTS